MELWREKKLNVTVEVGEFLVANDTIALRLTCKLSQKPICDQTLEELSLKYHFFKNSSMALTLSLTLLMIKTSLPSEPVRVIVIFAGPTPPELTADT